MALELVTFAEIKALLGLTKSTLAEYPALEVILDTMITSFEEEIGRKLDSESRTETIFVNGFKTSQVKLNAIPVTAMTSVIVTSAGDSESFTENEDYEVARFGLRLWTKLRNVKIVVMYTGGLSAVTEEPNLNRAALYQLGYEFQSKEQIGASTVSNEGGSVQRPELQLLKETKRLLRRSWHPLHTGT